MTTHKFEGHKRFRLIPEVLVTEARYDASNTKTTWHDYIASHFCSIENIERIKYRRTISNAAFRICGVEVKTGLLLADYESKKPLIHGAVKPSLVIDTVLSLYSIFEGLGTLLFLATSLPEDPNFDINANRRDKWKQSLSDHLKHDTTQKICRLIALRDRCIHQDQADLKDETDFQKVFQTQALKGHIELLDDLLRSLEVEQDTYPDTVISDFHEVTLNRSPQEPFIPF